jgi:hypothetical protein
MSPTPAIETQSPVVRSFLRSLNILLKSARMYGMDHARTTGQLTEAWGHLQAAFGERRNGGLQFAMAENRLLVDGVLVKAGPAEQSFARLLSAADLASITFTPQAKAECFREIVRIFAESGSKPEGAAARLKAAVGNEGQSGIRINEVRFVPAGCEQSEGTVAAQLLAQTLGADSGEVQEILRSPSKLLHLITAVEVASTGTKVDSQAVREGSTGVAEEDTAAIIRLLGKLARDGGSQGTATPAKLSGEFSTLSPSSQAALQEALAEFAETRQTSPESAPLLLRVAEHLAVRLALDRYERGDSRVDAVTDTLNRMNREIESLRQALAAYEHKPDEPGYELDRPADILEQKFWSQAPDSARLDLLLSEHAWQMPSRHVREFVEQLAERGEVETLQEVLLNYVTGIHSALPEARRKTALGLKDLAEHYPRPAGQPLRIAIRHVGEQLANETDAELQKLIGATFVLLGQEAATRRRYAAVLQMMASLEAVEKTGPELAASLRARIGLENRIPDFLEEALRVPQVPLELMELLRRVPLAASEHIAGRISRCTRRRERDRLVKMAEELGPGAVAALREAFQSRSPAAAVVTVGLLSRLDPAGLEEPLRARLHEWNRMYHDAVVRQIASAASPVRGRILVKLLGALDSLVVPLALDEIGMSGDPAPAPLLLGIAGGELPKLNAPFVLLKAIEALGRLRVREAAPLLISLIAKKEPQRAAAPREIQIAAAQALQQIDREGAKPILSGAGFKPSDLEPAPLERSSEPPGVRQRYYPRVKLSRTLSARLITMDGEFPATVRELSLGGGLCSCEQRSSLGAPALIRIKSGMRGFEAKVVLRDARSEMTAFEIVDMDLEDRARLRALLQAARR